MDAVIAYDVANTDTPAGARRLRHVADICAAYGERAQHSVFECRLTAEAAVRLAAELADAIDPQTDSIIIYRITGQLADSPTVIGTDRPHRTGTTWIV